MSDIPTTVLMMKPVDGGRAMIGLIECPHCGETHYTTNLECGERKVFCGIPRDPAKRGNIGCDGYSKVCITRIC